MARLKKITKYQSFWPLMVFLAILLINGIVSGGDFFEIQIVDGHLYGRIIDIFRNGAKLMLLATGMTMVLATGGTDISVGSVMAISGAVACSIVDGRILPGAGGSVAVAVVLAVVAGIVCGAWNGLLVSRVNIQPIVATMILMVAGRGIAQLISDGKIVTISSDAYYFINGGYVLGLPFPIFLVAFFVAAAILFTKKTAFGLFVESTGVNPVASRFAGINVASIKFVIYTFCGAMAAVAGLVESAGIKGADANNMGLMIEMDGILAVALGGTSLAGGRFSIPASIVGALIIQSITTSVYAMGVAPQITQVGEVPGGGGHLPGPIARVQGQTDQAARQKGGDGGMKTKRRFAVAIEGQQSAPSLSQAQRMRELDQKNLLQPDMIDGIMLEEKKEADKVILSSQELGQYFGKDKTPREMKDTIMKLLDEYKAKQAPELGKPEKKAEQEK